jgi:prevent-host-death family protein
MSNMKTASIREVQHGFAKILERVGDGEEIVVTRRGKPVARIVPPGSTESLAWPDSAARLKRLVAEGAGSGTPPSKIIVDLRRERL